MSQLPIDTLAAFFRDPSGYFLTEQLGVAPHLEAHHRAERENLELERLEKYALLRLLYDFTDAPDDINDDIDNQVDERTLDLILKTPGAHLATATGKLPPGSHGALAYADAIRVVNKLRQATATHGLNQQHRRLAYDLTLTNALSLVGQSHPVTAQGDQIIVQVATLDRAKSLAAWIHHLALASTPTQAPAGQAPKTIAIGRYRRTQQKRGSTPAARPDLTLDSFSVPAAPIDTLRTLVQLLRSRPNPACHLTPARPKSTSATSAKANRTKSPTRPRPEGTQEIAPVSLRPRPDNRQPSICLSHPRRSCHAPGFQ